MREQLKNREAGLVVLKLGLIALSTQIQTSACTDVYELASPLRMVGSYYVGSLSFRLIDSSSYEQVSILCGRVMFRMDMEF